MSDTSNLPAPKLSNPRSLSDAQKRARRARSIALALVLGGLVLLFYIYTIAKLGGNVLSSSP